MRWVEPVVCVLVATGCSDSPDPRIPNVAVEVAPLNLPGIAYACYDVRVDNDAGDEVWSAGERPLTRSGGDLATLCSDQFGNVAGGSISYVGPCDATDSNPNDGGTAVNTITLWVDGLYAADDTDIGEWQDPCPNGCALTRECVENADVSVVFNLTIMRDAQQGFFDIAVNFEDVFCSAKLDCVDELLQRPGGERDATAVLAFACTSGSGDTETNLYLNDIAIDCAGSEDYTIAPVGPGGNLGAQSPGLFQTAVYHGAEELPGYDKCYWNVAIGLDDDATGDELGASCVLDVLASASETAFEDTGSAFQSPAATAYPYIRFSVALTDDGGNVVCGAHPLNVTDSGVTTEYTDVAAESGLGFDHAMRCGEDPVDPAPLGWTRLSFGGYQSCGLNGGRVFCWGLALNATPSLVPMQIGSDDDWTSLSAGFGHGCGIRGGQLYCWGLNHVGQVGNGSYGPDVNPPAPVGGPSGWGFVGAGGLRTCGVQSGSLFCWGEDLIAGGETPGPVPLPVGPLAASGWSLLSEGTSRHNCGLHSSGLYCWGRNNQGQLGIGVAGAARADPTLSSASTDWTLIAGGDRHTCGIRAGLLFCWGGNSEGQLGIGEWGGAYSTPQQVGTDGGWTDVAASDSETTCGVRAGSLYCWGANYVGTVGDGTLEGRNAPVQVGSATDWIEVACGSYHCGGIRRGGFAYTWGDNSLGQIGDGTVGNHLTPTPVLAVP